MSVWQNLSLNDLRVPLAKDAKTKTYTPTHEEFVFRVRSPSTSYGFSTQIMRHERDAFWEHQTVTFMAECLYPDRFIDREVTVRLSGYRDQMDMKLRLGGDWKPPSIGYMEVGKSRFEVHASLPLDACWQVGAALSARSITSMLLNGPVLHRGKTTLTSISFEGPEFDPVGYIG
jgi:hypothetical protein